MGKQSNIIVEQAVLSSDSATPATGYSKIYPKSDGYWYIRNSNGTIILITPKDIAEQTYTGTIVWTGTTAPSSTTTHTYQWTQIGKLVTLRINLKYATAGSANTVVTMTLPPDCPAPFVITGFSGNDVVLVGNYGSIGANTTVAATSIVQRAFLRANSSNTGWLIGVYSGTAVNATIVTVTMQYWAA